MKKNYFSTFFAALMLLVAIPATAQVNSMADLFGKYQFTATINPTEAGQEYTDYWDNECEVTIASEPVTDDKGQVIATSTSIKGFLGAMQDLLAGQLDTEKCEFYVGNPNPGYGLLDPNEGIGIADPELEMKDFALKFQYNPQTKDITISDFSIYKLTNFASTKAEELAKVTNAKLTAPKEVTDLSGEWNFVAEGETTPDWSMVLTATDESNKNYNISFKYGEFAPANLSATFNGTLFSIALNNSYLDADNKVYLADGNGTYENASWDFELTNANELTLIYGIAIMQKDSNSPCLEWYQGGKATRSGAEEENPGESEEEAFTWVGTYTVTAKVEVLNNTYEYPKTGEMEIRYDEQYEEYVITKIFGQDITFNQGGWGLSAYPTDDPNQIEIDLSLADGLVNIGDGYVLGMFDINGTDKIPLTLNENGTVSIGDFKVMKYSADVQSTDDSKTHVATYTNVTAVKKGDDNTGEGEGEGNEPGTGEGEGEGEDNEPGTGEGEGEEEDNAVESVIVENKAVMGIFDLLGRKLDAITGPGLYIVNGKKVVIK